MMSKLIGAPCIGAAMVAMLSANIVLFSNVARADGYAKDRNSACAVFKPNLKPSETVVWQGSCANGFAQGQGIARWSARDGSTLTFQGQFVGGKLQGEGKMTGSGGDQFQGFYKDGKRDGFGTYSAASGTRYQGQYKNNLPHGRGQLTLATGQKAERERRDGVEVSTRPITLSTPEAYRPPEPPRSQNALTTTEPPAVQPQLNPKEQVGSAPLATQRPLQSNPQRQSADRMQQQPNVREMSKPTQTQPLNNNQAIFAWQKLFESILSLLMLASPALLALLVWKTEWKPALQASNKMEAWLDESPVSYHGASGFFSKYFKRPFRWGLGVAFNLSASIASQSLKAGVRLAACLYIAGAILTIALWVAGVVIGLIFMVLFTFVMIFIVRESMRSLGLSSGSSGGGMSTAFRVATAFAGARRESREHNGLLGKYTETADEQGNVVAVSRERDGLLGKYTETKDAHGNVVTESREREGLLGKYTETKDAHGNVVTESHERDGLLGKYTETTDAHGNVVTESRERDGFLGKYTEHKKP